MPAAVSARGLGVRFFFDRQKRPVTPLLAGVRRHCVESWGLRDLDLDLGPGESVGLMGANGAGKTTLLRAIAGVMEPDAGHLEVRGRVGSLLAIDGGLLPLLTGRENALLLGVLAGLSRADSRARLESIRDVSTLGDAFDRPVSTYSQGMRARLGFAVMEQTDPQVLLLDEVHEALDREFRERVEARVRTVVDAGGIVVAAGHDHGLLARMCESALLMEDGRVRARGPFAQVVAGYEGAPV